MGLRISCTRVRLLSKVNGIHLACMARVWRSAHWPWRRSSGCPSARSIQFGQHPARCHQPLLTGFHPVPRDGCSTSNVANCPARNRSRARLRCRVKWFAGEIEPVGRSSGRDVAAVLEACPSVRSMEPVDKFGALVELLDAVPSAACFRALSDLGADFISVRGRRIWLCYRGDDGWRAIPSRAARPSQSKPQRKRARNRRAKNVYRAGIGPQRCNASARIGLR